MLAKDVLAAMAEDDVLAEEVLGYLNMGMWDEWDCDLWTGIPEMGFGGVELQVAAKSGLQRALYDEEHGNPRS